MNKLGLVEISFKCAYCTFTMMHGNFPITMPHPLSK